MEVSLRMLIKSEAQSLADETRLFHNNRKAVAKKKRQPDPTTPDGLQQARNSRKPYSALADRNVVQRMAEWKGNKVPVRIILPQGTQPQGVYLNIPGGGFYLDEAARNDAYNARVADSLGMVVISVEYRLAPENPWPAAPDDCETVARWLIEHAESQFGSKRLIIGGTSAGATLALTTLLRLKNSDLASSFIGAVLQYGAYDLSGQTPGGRLFANEYFIQAYTTGVADKTQPDISPLYSDLKGLPPVLLIVGTADILLEDTFALMARLSAAGNAVDLQVYPEAGHGFTGGLTKMAKVANKNITEWIKKVAYGI